MTEPAGSNNRRFRPPDASKFRPPVHSLSYAVPQKLEPRPATTPRKRIAFSAAQRRTFAKACVATVSGLAGLTMVNFGMDALARASRYVPRRDSTYHLGIYLVVSGLVLLIPTAWWWCNFVRRRIP